jgi:hypothetical protein
MTDLETAPPRDNGPLTAVLLAFGILIAITVAVVFLNPRKTAELTVQNVQTFAPHTEFKATPGAVHILGQPQASEDDLYVVASVHLQDKLRLPIFVSSVDATITTSDGTTYEATTILPGDWPRLTTSFPALATMLTQPLVDGAEASPGGAVDGTVLLLFPDLKADDWTKKKSASLKLGLAHQDPITVALP